MAHLHQTQQLSSDPLLELYQLDTSTMTLINGVVTGGQQYFWTPGSANGANLVYQGISYTPMPIDGSGFEWNGQGKMPVPTLTVSNIGGLVAALVIQNNDLSGAMVTRLKVYSSNLDNAPIPDNNYYFENDVFFINRKISQTKQDIKFELRAFFDAQGLLFPRRQIIRDTCTHIYRHFNPASQTFVQGTCPYTGTSCFDAGGTVTGATHDVCGKKMSDCRLRFGNGGILPTYAFPGAGISQGTP